VHHRIALATPATNVIPIPDRRESRPPSTARLPLRIVRIKSWDELPELASGWASLLERCPDISVFQTYQWNRSWWDAFGSSGELLLLLCYSGSQLVGIAPMMETQAHARVWPARREIRFIGSANNASDYCDFLIDRAFPGALDVLLNEICINPSQADCLHLTNMQGHSATQAAIRRFFRRRQSSFVVERDQVAPCRILGNEPEDRKATNKSSLRRHYNWFRKAGDLRFHRCASQSEIYQYLDRFFDQHLARREFAGTYSQFQCPDQRDFFVNLVESLFPQGWLKFDVLLFNGEPLAFHFGFEYRNRFIWYKPTFDVAYANRSPGEVLIKSLLEDAVNRGLEEFDFTVGSEPFKFRFANKTRFTNRLIVFRSRYAYWWYEARDIVAKIRRRLRSSRSSQPLPSPEHRPA
jgi:CelD/BcsL family acetyltransferase involved in cellulose biosynthesis